MTSTTIKATMGQQCCLQLSAHQQCCQAHSCHAHQAMFFIFSSSFFLPLPLVLLFLIFLMFIAIAFVVVAVAVNRIWQHWQRYGGRGVLSTVVSGRSWLARFYGHTTLQNWSNLLRSTQLFYSGFGFGLGSAFKSCHK